MDQAASQDGAHVGHPHLAGCQRSHCGRHSRSSRSRDWRFCWNFPFHLEPDGGEFLQHDFHFAFADAGSIMHRDTMHQCSSQDRVTQLVEVWVDRGDGFDGSLILLDEGGDFGSAVDFHGQIYFQELTVVGSPEFTTAWFGNFDRFFVKKSTWQKRTFSSKNKMKIKRLCCL